MSTATFWKPYKRQNEWPRVYGLKSDPDRGGRLEMTVS